MSLRVRMGVVLGYGAADTLYAGSDKQPREDTDHYAMQVKMASLLAGVDLAGGRGATLVLPWALITTTSDVRNTSDHSIGDMELRLRQDVSRLLWPETKWAPRLTLSLGAVAPTGPYVTTAEILAATGDQAPERYVSLGRGAWWLLADAQLSDRFTERFGWSAGLLTRTPLTKSRDGFEWGDEMRGSLGLNAVVLPDQLFVATSIDLQWRGLAHELDYTGERVEFLNGGGRWLDLAPSLQAKWTDRLSTTLGMRLPLWREVHGVQTVQAYTLILSVTALFGGGREAATARTDLRAAHAGDAAADEIAAQLVAGHPTLVDYWATWCAPCLALSAKLDAFVAEHPEIKLVKIEASNWTQPEMDKFLPTVIGLPALDIFGPDGRLLSRLQGPATADFALWLPGHSSSTEASPR